MLASTLALWLACPPTADARAAPKQAAQQRMVYVNPYGHLQDSGFEWEALPLAPIEPPTMPDLPLWDLQATLASLPSDEGSNEWVAWLRWTIARAQARPATAHHALVRALASAQLSAARLAWWRTIMPASIDSRDALLEAFERADTPRTRFYLAAALALSYWQLACPVPLGSDGACRAPNTSTSGAGQAMVSRDPIQSESAQHWARTAAKLHRKAKLASDELATQALLAELHVIAADEDYEGLLAARAPDDLSFEVDEWLADSEDPEALRALERQAQQRERSIARFAAFYDSYERCRGSQYQRHSEQVHVDARLATRVLLREATHLLAEASVYEGGDSIGQRSARRREAEAGARVWRWMQWTGPTTSDILRDVAGDMARRCVEIGTTRGATSGVVNACFALLDELADAPPPSELLPEPRSSTVMQRPAVVAPEFL